MWTLTYQQKSAPLVGSVRLSSQEATISQTTGFFFPGSKRTMGHYYLLSQLVYPGI